MDTIKIFWLLTTIVHCDGYQILDLRTKDARRFNIQNDPSVILGAPLYPSHLPESDPILPGHTLIRPAMGTLKSAVRFPHRDQENGAGVYGHIDNTGIRYGGRNERVMYSGFRRMLPSGPPDDIVGKRRQRRFGLSWKDFPRQKRNLMTSKYKPIKKFIKKLLKEKERQNQLRINNILNRLFTKRYFQHSIENKKPHRPVYIFYDNTHLQQKGQRTNKKASQMKPTDLYLHPTLKSHRRQDPTNQGPTVALGTFVLSPDSNEAEANLTQQFWETKDAYNHIKISSDAPELSDLLPADAYDDLKTWWFYHQNDFEEFQDRLR